MAIAGSAEFGGGFGDRFERQPQFGAIDGERDVGLSFRPDVLHDHVDRDPAVGDLGKNAETDAGAIGSPFDRHPGLFFHQGHAANGLIGQFRLGDDHRAGRVGKAAPHVNRHGELFGELDRAAMHHAGPQAGELEHFVVADPLHAAGFGQLPRIGRVDAVDVGVNLASVGLEHRGQGDRRRVAAAAPQRGDVVILVDTLKAGRDDDVSLVQRAPQPGGRNRMDAGLGVRAVGLDADLGAGQADRLVPQRMNGHRHQRHAHLLAGRKQHVQLAGRGAFANFMGQGEQHVGILPHLRHHHPLDFCR